jgi:holo-[acyl-carrier protein] synthase
MKINGIGLDIAEISRFRALLKKDSIRFVENTYTALEQTYCFSYRDPAPHLAGMFAAKEATRKATGDMTQQFSAVEVRHTKEGKPEIWIKGKRSRSILISISHSKGTACAVAIKQTL